MNNVCEIIHKHFGNKPRFTFPFDDENISLNGIYILFEKGEICFGVDRIVRIGIHRGQNNLRERLQEHITENKDRSIFRKNIGRALLNKVNDPYLYVWEIDFTNRENREHFSHLIDEEKQRGIEERVSKYIQENISFTTVRVDQYTKRRRFEEGLIATISWCKQCKPSENWLGNFSPIEKIRQSGLWNVHHLFGNPLTDEELEELFSLPMR